MSSPSRDPIRVLIFAPSLIPSIIIGVLRPLVMLERLGEVSLRLRLSGVDAFVEGDIQWCDVAAFCRNCEISDIKNLYRLKQLGKRIVYEIDDNFEEIPLNTELAFYHRSFYRLHVLRRFYELADLVRVYSVRMQQRAAALGANVRLVRSYFDMNLINNLPKPQEKSGIVRIAYPTGRIDDPRLEQFFFTALRDVLAKFRGRVELHLWGKSPPEQLAGIDGVFLNSINFRYEKFIKSLYLGGFDIGLAPSINEPFFHSKTNNKYREFGGCAIAGIYSNTPPYADCVVQNISGLLVEDNADAWVEAISSLIENQPLRRKIVFQAQADVKENFNFAQAADSWRDCLRDTLSRSPVSCTWLPDDEKELMAIFFYASRKTEFKDEEREALSLYRFAQFTNVVHLLSGDYIPPQNLSEINFDRIVKDIKRANFVLLAIDICNDLSECKIIFQLCNSIILDLSMFRESCDDLRPLIVALDIRKPVSLLIAADRPDMYALAKVLQMPFGIVSVWDRDMETKFSLRGYNAAYMDLFEKHIVHGKSKRRPKLIGKMQRAKNRTNGLVERYFRRFKIAWSLIRWRLGGRPL